MPTQIIVLKEPIRKLLEIIRRANGLEISKSQERIKVNQVAGTLAFWYEKIRNIVDYQEEHLLRKNAAERILKRLIFIEGKRRNIAEFLIYELIRARYLSNNTLGVSKISQTEQIINKYLLLLDKIGPGGYKKEELKKISNWLIGIAAYEIEKNLVPFYKKEALVASMYETLAKDLVIPPGLVDPKERDLQIYLAVLRALIKSDWAMLNYYVLKAHYPDWFSPNWEKTIDDISKNIAAIKDYIERELAHPFGEDLLKFCKKRAVAYLILYDLLRQPNKGIYKALTQSPAIFAAAIGDACAARYKTAKEKLKRAVKRSVLYIFITKVSLAFILEIPYESMIIGSVNYFLLGVNVIFPPWLMLMIGSTIAVPAAKNTNQIIREIDYIVYERKKREIPPYPVKFSRKRPIFKKLFTLLYVIMFLISFSILIFALSKLKFNIANGSLFVFFLTIVSFFGLKIRQSVRELIVVDEKEGLITAIVDFISLPIVQVGRWFSEKFSQINVFIFVLDVLIETPFKFFVEIFDKWLKFLREKKEEIY